METGSENFELITSRRRFLFATGTGFIAATGQIFSQTISASQSESATKADTTLDKAGSEKTRAVAIIFGDDVSEGEIIVTYAALKSSSSPNAEKDKKPGDFQLKQGNRRLEIQIDDAHIKVGAMATRVTVKYQTRNVPANADALGFTFFLRDVHPSAPIVVRGLRVAVVAANDQRPFDKIEAELKAKNWKSDQNKIDIASEESYANASNHTKSMRCPTWLGVGRDMRIFRAMPNDGQGIWGSIEAEDYSTYVSKHNFALGRGANCNPEITRRLDDGVLPILKSVQKDGDIEYRLTIFATLENEPLTPDNVRGTDWLAAYNNTLGAKLTPEEKARYEKLRKTEVTGREQELICWVHVDIVNTSTVPRYAYFKISQQKGQGFTTDKAGNVVVMNRLNGKPVPQTEMAVLVRPDEKTVLELIYPHRPFSKERAEKFAKHDFETHYQACRKYWQHKLDQGSRVSVPDPAVDERIRAGLLHLDIVTQGKSSEGPLLANVGHYPPIGSESAPIIQAYDSFGYHEIAERCIQLFLDRQRADGFIMTYENYQLETGPVLWTIGEHFRFTRDIEWARRILPNVVRACNYILAWRRRNMKEELRGKGYGLLEGRVADPFDYYHSYMLNALAYVGLKRVVEVYEEIDASALAEVKNELAPYLKDIRDSYADNVLRSPVIPLGDGTWIPSFSPWAEYAGPVSLYADGGNWHSHGIFACRDSLIGSLHLGIGEVLDPNEQLSEWLLHSHQELMTLQNAGMSQPYYCRHDWLHLKRGEVKQFLKTYYNQFASLQDRETYSFNEHYFGVSQHKTHEEAWFLMQTRWMLWHEDYENGKLNLLSMIPREWLEAGKQIKLEKCVSHFGKFSLNVRASDPLGTVEATFELHGEAKNFPKSVSLRLPHPHEKKPSEVNGGKYNPKTESIEFKPEGKVTKVTMRFG